MEAPAADRVLIDKLDIVFKLRHSVQYGEHVVVVGSHPLLGQWVLGSSQGRMVWQQGDIWTVKIQFESVEILTKPLEYKYAVVKGGENSSALWETIPNRQLHVSLVYPNGVLDDWNRIPHIDPAFLARQAESKKTWLAQAEKLRALREADPDKNAPVANKPQILEGAAILLELKQLDADWAVVFGPKTVKIRWQFMNAKGEDDRMQAQFRNRTSVSFEEVKREISKGTALKYGEQVLKKVEVKLEKNAAGALQWREVVDNDERFRLPLIFPGPLLKSTHAFVFRVQFEAPPAPLLNRGKYLGYLEG